MDMPENVVADLEDFPTYWCSCSFTLHIEISVRIILFVFSAHSICRKFSSYGFYQAAFFALFAYFISAEYYNGRNNSFMTLDKTSGVCIDDASSTSCCQVPQSITGTFLADTAGRWNTFENFSYVANNYAVTVAGLEYTKPQWREVMSNISKQLEIIGSKSVDRDFAW